MVSADVWPLGAATRDAAMTEVVSVTAEGVSVATADASVPTAMSALALVSAVGSKRSAMRGSAELAQWVAAEMMLASVMAVVC